MFIYILKLVLVVLTGANFGAGHHSLEATLEKSADYQKPQLSQEAPLMVINADAAVVLDVKSGSAIFSQQANKEHAIASITKLMTALVFLEHNPGWEEYYQIKFTSFNRRI